MQYKAIYELTGVLYSGACLINNQIKKPLVIEWRVNEELPSFYFIKFCSLIAFIASLICSGLPVITNFISSLRSACFFPTLSKYQLYKMNVIT